MSSFNLSRALRFLAVLSLAALAACTADGGFSAGSTLRSMDNDAFEKSDDQYTSGLAVSFVSDPSLSFGEAPLPASVGAFFDEHWVFPDEDQHFVIYSISHRIFTPTDLRATEVVEGDLPYSASLYGTATIGTQNHNSMNSVSLSLGVVGPLALGEELQAAVHSVIDAADPAGWDNQLDNEPLLNLGVDSRRRLLRFGESEGFGGDFLSGVSASVGNLQSQATLASTLRLGYGVPTNFQMQAPFLAEEALGLRSHDRKRGDWSVYGFVGAAVTLLANAIYLDGNTFSDSHSVDHDNYVARGSLGLALRYKRFLINFSLETATVPWDHPDGLDYENYGRIGVSWDF